MHKQALCAYNTITFIAYSVYITRSEEDQYVWSFTKHLDQWVMQGMPSWLLCTSMITNLIYVYLCISMIYQFNQEYWIDRADQEV